MARTKDVDHLSQQRRSWQELAVFGGSPLFTESLHVNRPNAANRDRLIERIDGMLARRWFSDGPLVKEFEAQVGRLAGSRHCIATCSGTAALEIAIRALNMTGEVIVPSFTFAATVQALRWLNVTPVFCDADAKTHNIAPAAVERLITPRTTGIIGVHLWGQPCDIDALARIASQHGVSLLFDSAHAFGSSYKGRAIGGFGTAEVFSFHATKFVNAAEGGAITTDNDELAQKFRAARDFGFDADDRIVGGGTNGKMSELCAAMGLTYLESFDELIAANRATYDQYRSELANIPGISLLKLDSPDSRNYQYIVTTVDEAVTGLSRDELLKVLQAENILAKRYFYPGCHRMLGSYSETPNAAPDLPVTEELLRRVLVLPGGASIAADAIHGVCAILRFAVENSSQIRDALRV